MVFDLFALPRPHRIRLGGGIRKELYRRQGGRCIYCGSRQRMDLMDIDHRLPVARGGSNDQSNLQLLCRTCNQRKGTKTDREFRQAYRNAGVPQNRAAPTRTVRQSALAAAGKKARASRRRGAKAAAKQNPWPHWLGF